METFILRLMNVACTAVSSLWQNNLTMLCDLQVITWCVCSGLDAWLLAGDAGECQGSLLLWWLGNPTQMDCSAAVKLSPLPICADVGLRKALFGG